MKLKLALLILLIASIVNAETFVKRFAYIMDCPYTAYDNSYLNNCKESTAASSLFIFNYDNTSDVLWKTDKFEHRLYNVGRTEATTNDDGDSVYVYNFIADSGDAIQLVWQGTWLRLVFENSSLFEFSNVYHSNSNTAEDDAAVDM